MCKIFFCEAGINSFLSSDFQWPYIFSCSLGLFKCIILVFTWWEDMNDSVPVNSNLIIASSHPAFSHLFPPFCSLTCQETQGSIAFYTSTFPILCIPNLGFLVLVLYCSVNFLSLWADFRAVICTPMSLLPGGPGCERCGQKGAWAVAKMGHTQPSSSFTGTSQWRVWATDGEVCECISAALTRGLAYVLSKIGNWACNLSALQMCPQEGWCGALLIFLST